MSEAASLKCNLYLRWQGIRLFQQICLWGTCACSWDVKKPRNKQTNKYGHTILVTNIIWCVCKILELKTFSQAGMQNWCIWFKNAFVWFCLHVWLFSEVYVCCTTNALWWYLAPRRQALAAMVAIGLVTIWAAFLICTFPFLVQLAWILNMFLLLNSNFVYRLSQWPIGYVACHKCAGGWNLNPTEIIPVASKLYTLVTAWPDTWYYWVSVRPWWPSVCTLWLSQIACLICNFCLSQCASTWNCLCRLVPEIEFACFWDGEWETNTK